MKSKKSSAAKKGGARKAKAARGEKAQAKGGARIIKKYSNRRLYDSHTSAYITLGDLRDLVVAGEDFRVVNAQDGADITASALMQVLLSEELFGVPVFSEESLRNLILFCSGPMRAPLSAFFEQTMPMFGEMQKQAEGRLGHDFGAAALAHLGAEQGRAVRRGMEMLMSRSLQTMARTRREIDRNTRRAMDVGWPFPPADNDKD